MHRNKAGLDATISSRSTLTKADLSPELPRLDATVSSRAPEAGGKLEALKTDVDNLQTIIKFPNAEALNDIAVTAATDTTEKTITVALPTGASIVRVMLLTAST